MNNTKSDDFTRIIYWILNHFDSILKLKKIKHGIKNYARIIYWIRMSLHIHEAIILLFNSY
jgi:hypothetical protein